MASVNLKQVNLSIEAKIFERLVSAAEADGRRYTELAGQIFLWAFPVFERAGSIRELKNLYCEEFPDSATAARKQVQKTKGVHELDHGNSGEETRKPDRSKAKK